MEIDKASEEKIVLFNKLGFLSNLLINLIDQLEDTNFYNKQLKFHLNRARLEAEKISNFHFKAFNVGVDFPQIDGSFINSKDVHCQTSKSYDYLFEILSKDPSDIVILANFLKNAEENITADNNFSIPYEKLKN